MFICENDKHVRLMLSEVIKLTSENNVFFVYCFINFGMIVYITKNRKQMLLYELFKIYFKAICTFY
jgi:hypothetical protein